MIPYDRLNNSLLEALPELGERYEWETRAGLEGPHVVFGAVLIPAIEALLQKRKRTADEEQFLRRAFEFLERLAGDPDEAVQNVVSLELGEALQDDSRLYAAAAPYMGTATRDAIVE